MTREELIELKEKRGYSVAKLSEYSGVPIGTIRKIITGESKQPRTATLNALEKVLAGDEAVYSGKSYEYDIQSSVSIVAEEPAEYVFGSAASEKRNTLRKQGDFTIEDYRNLPVGERKELIDGVFYDMATPLFVHQKIVTFLLFEIQSFIRKNKGTCQVITSPSSVQIDCDEKTMMEPDLYIICDKNKIRKFGICGAPDFVLEVLSDSSRKKDLGIKLFKYIRAGVREIWYLDLKTAKLITYFADDDYMPNIHVLEGLLGISIYNGKPEIDLSEIGRMITELSELPE